MNNIVAAIMIALCAVIASSCVSQGCDCVTSENVGEHLNEIGISESVKNARDHYCDRRQGA